MRTLQTNIEGYVLGTQVAIARPAIWVQVNGAGTAAVPMTGTVNGVSGVTLNTRNTPVAPFGAVAAIAPQTVGGGSKFNGWGMANGYIPNAVTYTVLPTGIRYASQGGGRANRLGVKGSEELGGGLKAIYQIELGINPTDTNNNLINNADTISMRNTFVGLAGGWGTALMGRHDTPLKISTGKLDFFADTLADMNATVGFQDLRADNAVAYISPSFSGFTLAAAIVPSGGSNGLGNVLGATGGNGGVNTESDQINGAWSLAAIYSNGPFYASAAYESLSNEMFNDNARNFGCNVNSPVAAVGSLVSANPGAGAGSCASSDSDQTQWRFGLGLLDWNGFSLSAMYAHMDHLGGSGLYSTGQSYNVGPLGNATTYNAGQWWIPGGPEQMDLWQVQAGYSFGASTIKAMYGATGFDTDYTSNTATSPLGNSRTADLLTGDRSTWAVGYDYNFSKRTKVYALYTDVQDDRSDWIAGSQWSGFSLGMMHSF